MVNKSSIYIIQKYNISNLFWYENL